MRTRRALLIQDLAEYLAMLREPLSHILEYFTYTNATYEDALHWIISEELELIYGVFTYNHIHNHPIYSQVHQALNELLHPSLSEWTALYIKAPVLYSDNRMVEIEIIGRDIYISYFIEFRKIKILF